MKRIKIKFLELFGKFDIGEPPWDYNFLLTLDESEYPKYLAKLFKLNTGENLPLRFDWDKSSWVIDKNECKTFNQKLQWLKLYDATPLKKMCTDKVLVRDYVAEKIGEEYLKPVLQICVDFNEIDFDKLPDSFVIKCNHGCKWQYIIKDKKEFLNRKFFFDMVKKNITGWLEQDYSFWGGFEMQYKGIEPKILIEPLMRDDIHKTVKEIMIFFFNSSPKIILKTHNNNEISLYDENLNYIDDVLSVGDVKVFEKADDLIKQTLDLSNKLIKNAKFEFVRVDWMIYKNKHYFEEYTFIPYSGFKKLNIKTN